jgi:F0F1-type ATP synthase alpha subunit
MPVKDIQRYCAELKTFFESKYPELFKKIRETGQISDDLKQTIEKGLKELGEAFQPSEK